MDKMADFMAWLVTVEKVAAKTGLPMTKVVEVLLALSAAMAEADVDRKVKEEMERVSRP